MQGTNLQLQISFHILHPSMSMRTTHGRVYGRNIGKEATRSSTDASTKPGKWNRLQVQREIWCPVTRRVRFHNITLRGTCTIQALRRYKSQDVPKTGNVFTRESERQFGVGGYHTPAVYSLFQPCIPAALDEIVCGTSLEDVPEARCRCCTSIS